MNYVLDTNILLGYFREESKVMEKLNALDLFNEEENLLFISIVSSAELLSMAKQRGWGETKIKKMVSFVDSFLVIPIDTKEIQYIYAEIDAYSQGKLANKPLPTGLSSRNMGKNDLWIAATSALLDATLITMDKDFSHLHQAYFELVLLD